MMNVPVVGVRRMKESTLHWAFLNWKERSKFNYIQCLRGVKKEKGRFTCTLRIFDYTGQGSRVQKHSLKFS